MPARTKKLIVAGIAFLVVSGLLIVWVIVPSEPEAPSVAGEIVFSPRPVGRILHVVVEEDGAYIGKEFIPFLIFDRYLSEHRAELRPNYVIVIGTESARYGSAVQVYDLVRSILRVPSTIETRVLPAGTRRPAIEIRNRAWDI